jgi:hypothetical protein
MLDLEDTNNQRLLLEYEIKGQKKTYEDVQIWERPVKILKEMAPRISIGNLDEYER